MKTDDILEKKEYYSILLQIYENLLTESVKRRMESFYFDDLSLFEIAENEKVSRNAIFQSIKAGKKEIDFYEEKLHVYKRCKMISKLIDKKILDDETINKIREDYLYGIWITWK